MWKLLQSSCVGQVRRLAYMLESKDLLLSPFIDLESSAQRIHGHIISSGGTDRLFGSGRSSYDVPLTEFSARGLLVLSGTSSGGRILSGSHCCRCNFHSEVRG